MAEQITGWNEFEQRPVRELLGQLLASSIFKHADRPSRFLTYIVDETLYGHSDRSNRYSTAIDVFDRDTSFDLTSYAVVRIEAGRLRSKLPPESPIG